MAYAEIQTNGKFRDTTGRAIRSESDSFQTVTADSICYEIVLVPFLGPF